MVKLASVNKEDLTVYLPDTKGVTISRWGKGNTKLGPDVYTYSRLPGRLDGTCPGATQVCQDICYAKRVRGSTPAVWDLWARNSQTEDVPEELPPGAQYVRIHVSGDFTTPEYITAWTILIASNPHVQFWAYTRSWCVKDLLISFEILKELDNMQLFASVDRNTGPAPEGWRVAYLEDDLRLTAWSDHLRVVTVGGKFGTAYVCPEETGRKPNCQACQYCITGRKGDVVFLLH